MRSLIALPLLSLTLAACATDGLVDELAGESDDAATDGKADGTPGGVYTYFAIRSDAHLRASPYCGGFFLERLNRTTTECHDGSVAEACYTPELDWAEAGLSEATRAQLTDAAARSLDGANVTAMVRGRFAPTNTGKDGSELGRFIVTEAWVNQTDAVPAGVFAKVTTTPVVCITSPCENLMERGLNSSNHAMIADLEWTGSTLAVEQVESCRLAMTQPSGMIVAGDRYQVEQSGRTARGRTATAAYLRLADAAAGN
jgi:hypothetical protein